MHHLISGINSLTHFVSHVLIYLLLTHHTTMIILLRQRHHHHSCHPSPHHFFILVSKLFFFLNPILHRHLAPPRTDSTAIRTCSRFLFLLFSVFCLNFSFHYYFFYFLPFQFFSLILVVFTSVIFRILSFLHLTLHVFLFSVTLISFFF